MAWFQSGRDESSRHPVRYENEEERRESREERRVSMMETARILGVDMDFSAMEFSDDDDDEDEVYVTREQMEQMAVAEEALMMRLRSHVPERPIENIDVECETETCTSLASNVVSIDRIIRADVTSAFKEDIAHYAAVSKIYMLTVSWEIQERVFVGAGGLSGQLTRYGLTMADTWIEHGNVVAVRYSLDPYYHERRRELEKRRLRVEQHKTTLRVAMASSRLSELRKNLAPGDPHPTVDSDDEDAEGAGGSDMRDIGLGAGSLLPSDMTTRNIQYSIDKDELPAYVDDHVYMVVHLTLAAGAVAHQDVTKQKMTIADVFFVIRDHDF